MRKKRRSNNRPRRTVLRDRHLPRGLEILYEDSEIIVVDKPAGLLTVGTDTNKTKTVYYILTDYVRIRRGATQFDYDRYRNSFSSRIKVHRFCRTASQREGSLKSRNKIFVVHRLDQWTSGVLVLAKSEEIKLRLQGQWKETEKKYIAIVHGRLEQKEGIITSYLAENKAFVVYSTTDATKGKLARTAYKVLKEGEQLSLLEINLLTGRKNQIRVHLADKGHPIAGDRKYGKDDDGFKRLALHSKSISFKHPTSGRQMTFESKLPAYFERLLSNRERGRR